MNTELVNAVIEQAKKEKQEMDRNSAHSHQPGYNETLGYWVSMVFESVTGGEYDLPYSLEIVQTSDLSKIREYLFTAKK